MIDLNTFIANNIKPGTKPDFSALIAQYRQLTYQNEMAEIVGKVSETTGITADEMKVKTRKRTVVESRQLAMKMLKKHTRFSLAAIGEYFECHGHVFDHATVLHSCKTVDDLIDTDKYYKMRYDFIDNEIKKIREQ